jgi:hypothetical protein
MRLTALIVSAFSTLLPAIVSSDTFTLETSWLSVDAGALTTSASGVWVVTLDGMTVTSYGPSGSELDSWSTNRPGGPSDVYDRKIGVDGSGYVYVMTATRELGGWVQKFEPDGTLLESGPFEFPPDLGFAVDAAGVIHGGDDSFDDRVALLALGPDGTRYTSLRECCVNPIVGSGPGRSMVPSGPKCGGPTDVFTSCFTASYAAATESRLYISGLWCDAASDCDQAVHAFGPDAVPLGVIPQHGQLTVDASGIAYVLTSSEVIEKWVPSGVTPAATSSWGALKVRYR